MTAPFVASLLECALAAIAVFFALAAAPSIFRSLAPEPAGRVFGALARRALAALSVLAAGALAARVVAGAAFPVLLDAAILLQLLLSPRALRRFEEARAEAIREVPPSVAVPARSVIAAHERLARLRRGIGGVGYAAAVNIVISTEHLLRRP